MRLGFSDTDIAIGYLGGFVARASTVAISLFVPFFVNSFFIRNGFCHGSPHDRSSELKKECAQAYTLAAIISGVAQFMGIICAPVFGYVNAKWSLRRLTSPSLLYINWPVVVTAVLGIIGYTAVPQLPSPEFKDIDGRGGSPIIFLYAALIGISQIGAIVCSLGSIGRGVSKWDIANVITGPEGDQETVLQRPDRLDETAPLIENQSVLPEDAVSRIRLKGSVAGVYSWYGGVAILLLTKLGGYLSDTWSVGAPFYMMAIFNGILLAASLVIDIGSAASRRARSA